MIQSSSVTAGPQATLTRVANRPQVARGGARGKRQAARRTRALTVGAAVAGAAFAGGLTLGALHVSPAERAAERFAAAWTRGDFPAMYGQLSDGARADVTRSRFTAAYQRALDTATATRVVTGRPREDGGAYVVPVRVATRIFGDIAGTVRLPIEGAGVAWAPELVFPGLRRGERLSRTTRLPRRAAILARDKTPLAEGDERSSRLGPLASSIAGSLGAIPEDRRTDLQELGVPPDTRVGVSGLERVFDVRLIGRPGGELRAGDRVVARTEPRAAPPVRTTISATVQQAAVTALGGRLGGIVALDPRSGAVLAAAGIGFSGLQPPGSTFKIVTVTGALESRLTRPDTTYPVETKATLEGVDLENANGESCGGTLVHSFAESCNSVFAPLGASLGAERLVDVAERFGFNSDPGIPGAAMSTIPDPDEIGDALAVGSSAIGQGRVQATALQMAIVASTIGLRGRRPRPTLDFDAARRPSPTTRVTPAATARTVERLMLEVVRGGTGTAATIPSVKVAGKTGTAELRTTKRCEPDPQNPESCPPQPENDPTDTDAWFAAYAPAGDGRPKVAVGVLLVASGAGGDTAAPAARQVLMAALGGASSPGP
jgi:penicillin-binding protein A